MYPKTCYDKSHNHPVGGGHHWYSGYSKMLKDAQSKIGPNAILMSEDQNEIYINNVNIFLTLFGFGYGDFPFVTPMATDNILIPVHQAIYGGYTMYAGALFERNDFTNPDLFARKLAVQFMFGAQLGWFGISKYDRDRELPNKHDTHTYGIYNELMDAKYDAEI